MSSVNVGERIRQLRLGLGMSVRALAAKTGFSPSLISQAENGQVTPSIGSLERIAMALGVSLGKFFAEPETSTVHLVRASARPKLTSTWSPVSIEALAPLDEAGKIEPAMLILEPERRRGEIPSAPRGGKFSPLVERGGPPALGGGGHGPQETQAVTISPG